MEESEKAKGKIVGKFSQTSKKLKYRQLQIAAESKILFGVKKISKSNGKDMKDSTQKLCSHEVNLLG